MINHKNYNRRKLQILRLANISKGKLRPLDVQYNLDVTPQAARQLLHRYLIMKLFNHTRYGAYRLNKRGRARLAYLENRVKISKETGIDIGLNHHLPLPCSAFELSTKYREATGESLPISF